MINEEHNVQNASTSTLFHEGALHLASQNPTRIAEFERLVAKLFVDDFPVVAGNVGELIELQLHDRDRNELLPNGEYQKVSARVTAPKLVDGFQKAAKPFMCADAGLYCPGLGGYPATNIKDYMVKYCPERSRLQGLLHEANNNSLADNRAFFVEAVGAQLANGVSILVTGEIPGRIANALSEVTGFGFDDCFVPDEGILYQLLDGQEDTQLKQLPLSMTGEPTITAMEHNFARVSGEIKDWVSARAVAFARLGKELGFELHPMGEALLQTYSSTVWDEATLR